MSGWLRAALRARLRPPPGTSVGAYASVRGLRLLGDALGGDGRPDLPGVRTRDVAVGRDPDVPVRVYDPGAGTDRRRATVFLHGGGWITGGLDTNDRLCALLATERDHPVVAVDYRLAPEHRYPAALDDCERVLEWLATDSAGGLTAETIRLFGTSAGGTLAAAVHADPPVDLPAPVVGRTLAYPPLDPAFGDRRSDRGLVTRAARRPVRALWDLYLPADADRTDPRVAPLRASRFDGVPPTTVVTCGLDPLRAEGAAYTRLLADADVPVGRVVFPRLPHGALTVVQRLGRRRTAGMLRRIEAAGPAPGD